MPAPWTPRDDDALTNAHRDGLTLSQAARTIGRAKSTVSLHARQLGLDWSRSQVEAAVHATRIDAKAKRARLEHDLLDDAARLRTQLWQPVTVYNFGGRDNTYAEHELPEPSHADKLKIVQAAGAAIDRALRIAEHDADDGAATARSLLAGIANQLGINPTSE